MRRTTTIATLAAISAALVLAPSIASGKTIRLEGPVNQPFVPSPAGFATSVPSIQLKVTFSGKTARVIPGGTLKAEGLYGTCVFGAYGCSAYPGEAAHCHWFDTMFGDSLKVKKKKFSGTFKNGGEIDAPKDVYEGNYFTVTGRVGKKSATGTVHAHAYSPASADNPAATCDTGVLTWSARK